MKQDLLSIVAAGNPRYLAKAIQLVGGRPVKEKTRQMISGTVDFINRNKTFSWLSLIAGSFYW